MINEIMEYNKKFVENKAYEPYLTSKYPDKKLAILTCMDTRLIELLPADHTSVWMRDHAAGVFNNLRITVFQAECRREQLDQPGI